MSYRSEVLANSPVSYWRLGESSGTTASDEQGANDGTYNNSPTLGATALLSAVSDSAVELNGTDQYVSVGASASLQITGDLTLCAWIKGSLTGDGRIIAYGTGAPDVEANNYLYDITLMSSGAIRYFHEYGAGINVLFNFSNFTASADTIYFVCVTRDATAGEIKLYVDGSLKDTQSYSNAPTGGGSSSMAIGAAPSVTDHFDGVLDEVAIFNSVLSASAITDLYAAGILGSTVEGVIPPLVSSISALVTGSSTYNATITGVMPAIDSTVAASKTNPDSYIFGIMPTLQGDISASATSDSTTLYFATKSITTDPTSTPANTHYPGRLTNPGNYKREFKPGEFGVVKPSFGEVVIDNRDGAYDYLAEYGFDGQIYKLYYGDEDGVFPDDFTVVLIATMENIQLDYESIKIKLKDNLSFLDKPLLDDAFTGGGDLDGTSLVENTPKQRIFGEIPYAPVQLIDATKLIYFVCQEKPLEADKTAGYNSTFGTYTDADAEFLVFDGGVSITRKANYSNATEILNQPPSSGQCKFYFSDKGIFFRLGTSPQYDIRCRVKTWRLQGRAGDLGLFKISNFITESGLLNSYDISEYTALTNYLVETTATANNIGEITTFGSNLYRDVQFNGLVVKSSDLTYSDLLEAISKTDHYAIFVDRRGILRAFIIIRPDLLGYLNLPTEYEFTERNITRIVRELPVPSYKINIGYGQTFPGDTATGASSEVRDAITKEGFAFSYAFKDTSVLGKHKQADSIEIETPIREVFPVSVKNRAVVNLFAETSFYTITVEKSELETSMLTLELGSIVSLTLPRFNLSSGKLFMVVGVRHDYARQSITLTLWG